MFFDVYQFEKNIVPLVSLQNVPQVDAEGFCIRPEVNENDILPILVSLLPVVHPAAPQSSLPVSFLSLFL